MNSQNHGESPRAAKPDLGQSVHGSAVVLPPVAEKSNCHAIMCGPMIPLVTHYNRDLTLDLGAYKENIAYLMAHGIRTGQGCLLVAGAGGDFPMLSVPERIALVRLAAEVTSGKVPLVFCIQSTDVRVSQELAHVADEVGAFASQLSPPFYYRPSDEDVIRWYQEVDAVMKRSGLMVYNTFWEGYHLPFQVLDRLVSLDRVVSLKWSTPSGGLDYLKGVARYASQVAVIDNANVWPSTAMAGGTGFISHLASIMPEHSVELFHLTQAGKYKQALDSMQAVDWPWEQVRDEIADRTAGEAPPVKAALELCGRGGGTSRPPSRALTEEETANLRKVLVKIGSPVI